MGEGGCLFPRAGGEVMYAIDETKVVYADLDPKEGVVLHLDTKNYYKLNETSQLIWQALSAGKSESEISAQLSDRYDISIETARADVNDFIESLRKERLIQVKDAKLPSYDVEAAQKSKQKKR
jgi:hypothetical protein